jgi:hypothetical protein
MNSGRAEMLRRAIENLMTVKLLDAIARPGGVERLLAHRVTGVASREVRAAEGELERALLSAMPGTDNAGRNG